VLVVQAGLVLLMATKEHPHDLILFMLLAAVEEAVVRTLVMQVRLVVLVAVAVGTTAVRLLVAQVQ
jgi:hypothetical protein